MQNLVQLAPTTTTEKNWDKEPIDVIREGTKIILPKEMTYSVAITALQRKMTEDETVVSIYEEIETFPLDGAYALMNVLKDIYGWASPVPTPGMFGERPPTMVNLEIDFETHTQVFWGGFSMPGIEGMIECGASNSGGRFVFVISGKVKKKFQEAVKEIAERVRKFVKTRSVYKGKAIRLVTDDDGDLNFSRPPTFLDLKRVKEEELVLPTLIREQVTTSLFTPIEYSEVCRRHSIPLKRGVLLEGPYGTGKTLTAYVTAKKCSENGWTFIYLDRVQGIQTAFKFAKQYAPAVIFAEDIDRVTSGERDMELDDILNQIDGIDAKNTEIITILTTNHVEGINKAMMRPGRLDAVISILPPDKEAAEKLVRIYARDLLDEDEDLTDASSELAGQIPAVIRECVERAKLYSISRSHGRGILSLKGDDIKLAAQGMTGHLGLMKTKIEPKTTAETFAESLQSLVTNGLATKLDPMSDTIDEIRENQ